MDYCEDEGTVVARIVTSHSIFTALLVERWTHFQIAITNSM